MSVELIRETGKRLSNWGRWGADDQRGTLNHVSAESIRHAATLVKTGRLFRLGFNYDENGPQIGSVRGRINPIHTMLQHAGDAALATPAPLLGHGYTDDIVLLPLQCGTQWDGLAHVFYDGHIYNGFSTSEVLGGGAKKDGIEHICEGIIGRAVLLDIPRYKGLGALPRGYAITQQDLDGCAEKQQVKFRGGDILLLRTGMIQSLLAGDRKTFATGSFAGLSFYTLEWLHRNRIAAIAVDNLAVEVRPTEFPDMKLSTPFHLVAIRDMGLTLGEIFNFEALAAHCQEDGVYEFMFSGTPLPITGGVGSPLNPIAIK